MARRAGFNPFTLKKNRLYKPHRETLVSGGVWRAPNRWRQGKSILQRPQMLEARLPKLPQYDHARS